MSELGSSSKLWDCHCDNFLDNNEDGIQNTVLLAISKGLYALLSFKNMLKCVCNEQHIDVY